MKTFKFPQNKWVMTATLAAVLGLNMSINYQPSQVEAAEFASTDGVVVESEVLTADGPLSVKYVNNGESEVLAIVSKRDTEGKVCDNCYQTIPLQTQNKEDIKALNSQLQQVLRAKEAAPAKAAAPAKPAVEPEEAVPVKRDPFASVERACKRHTENADLLECKSKEFTSVLRKKSSSEIDAQDALIFFQNHIEPSIKSEITDSRNKLIQSQLEWFKFTSGTGSIPSLPLDKVLKQNSDTRENTLKVVREIISQTPGKFNRVRERLLDMEAELVYEEARKIQQLFITGRDHKDSLTGIYSTKEGEFRREDLQRFLIGMQYQTSAGLAKAMSNDFINLDLQRQHESTINRIIQQVRDSFANPFPSIENNTTPGTTASTIPNLSIRLANPGRNTNGQTNGSINRSQVGPDLSQRLGNRVQNPAMGMRGRQ